MSTQHASLAHRRTVLYISKLLFVGLGSLPVSWAAPIRTFASLHSEGVHPKDPEDPSLWLDLTVSIFLVLLGGIFAGLTIALMGQDEINLQVIAKSGVGAEKKHAVRVLRLLTKGKHWVLVTLLLSNVITNETLPIVLDRSLGGGWPAVLGSTIAIVIFGEIIPQSVCVRWGLAIGAWMSPFVLMLMYIEAPVAYPIAKLLDRLIGEDHGTTYSKAGLKTLVTIHKTFGEAGERLNEDEVTIIGAVLDLKNKPVGDIMTPMDDVFTMSTDTILDEKMMETILSAGYSRIPIHRPDNPLDFVGMLLVKILITYDPEDCQPVRNFALATLPETAPETSCLDILNFFQEGKSHMVLVSENPGENEGAVGVITLEDVIEELIGEEIVDESDVYIDVHKAIRRLQPAPAARISKSLLFTTKDARSRDGSVYDPRTDESGLDPISEYDADDDNDLSDVPIRPRAPSMTLASPKPPTTLTLRRRSSGNEAWTVTTRSDSPDLREKLKHLGPSNLASRPRTTRFQNVKIKPGATSAENVTLSQASSRTQPPPAITVQLTQPTTGGVGEGLVRNAGIDAHDGVQALHTGYGTMDARPISQPNPQQRSIGSPPYIHRRAGSSGSASSSDTVASMPKKDANNANESSALLANAGRSRMPRGMTRSGSITEQIIEYNGIRKVVLDISSSSDDQPTASGSAGGSGSATGSMSDMASRAGRITGSSTAADSGASASRIEINPTGGDDDNSNAAEGFLTVKKKKKRRRKRASKKGGEHDGPGDEPHDDHRGGEGDDAGENTSLPRS